MKILLSTYSCFPCQSSEPGNAWRAINEALKEHEVWALIETVEQYERLSVDYLPKNPMPNLHPIYFSLPSLVERPLRGRGTLLDAVYYHLWQESAVKLALDLHKKIGFDLCHHVTFGRYWSPSCLRVLNIPFIWGPVGAAETPPANFVTELPMRYRVMEFLRDSARHLSCRTSSLRETARAATIGIGVTPETCKALRELGVRRVEQMPQLALTDGDLAQFNALPAPPPGPLRAICIGRHVHWKGFYLAIRAFAQFAAKSPGAELWILSNGPFRKELEKTAVRCGIKSRVKFFGSLPRYEQVLEKIGQSHVLMHPALHEGFGNVCLEAMAAGRPVICLDIGGPASQITPETGFAAPMTSPADAVAAMAGHLEKLDRDRPLLMAMSAAARKHVQKNFAMRDVNETMRKFYAEAVEIRRSGADDRLAL